MFITSIHNSISEIQSDTEKLTLEVGKRLLYCNESQYCVLKEIVEQAQNRPMERERIVSQIEKLGNRGY